MLEESRLVTVTGPGGVGKTRLAGAVARQVAGRFADGAWLAELAAVRDPAQVAAVVAAALGIPEQPGVAPAEALARVLARQQVLLVLDNCEQVMEAAAQRCAGLLAACDDVRVLATSREPLAVAGETRYRLAPLTLPAPDDPADGGRSEAVALFADRARRADARFVLDGQAGPVVARLVARLDGMPLAIELAAARVEALGVAQLLDRIDDRFALLMGGDRLAAAGSGRWPPPWSGATSSSMSTSDRCSVRCRCSRPGSRWREPRRSPGRAPERSCCGWWTAPLLIPPREGPDGRPRYAMLETLRGYAAGLLAGAREHDGAVAALAGYALRVAEEAAAGLDTGTGEVAAARRLDAEDATMRQVLAWAMQHDAAIALRMAVALAQWWVMRGRLTSQYPLLREVAGNAVPGSDEWCAAQYWLGRAAQFSADLAGALGHFTAVCDAAADRPPSRALTAALRPGINIAADGPDCRGGRRRPPLPGAGTGDREPGRGAAGPGRAQSRRRLRR